MTKKRPTNRSGKQTRSGKLANLLRAVVLEGMGILVLAGLIGYPILTQTQWRVSSVDAEPSAIDVGLHTLLAKVGLLNDRD